MGPGHPQLRVLQQALFSGTQDFTLQRMIGDHLNMDDLHLGGWVSNVVTKRKPEPQSAGSIQSICVRMKCVTCHVSRVTCLLSDTAALNIGDEEIMACMWRHGWGPRQPSRSSHSSRPHYRAVTRHS